MFVPFAPAVALGVIPAAVARPAERVVLAGGSAETTAACASVAMISCMPVTGIFRIVWIPFTIWSVSTLMLSPVEFCPLPEPCPF